MTVRICSPEDFDTIRDIVGSNNYIYGVELDDNSRKVHLDFIWEALSSSDKCVVGAERDGRLTAITVMKFSAELPVWFVLLAYFEAMPSRTQAGASVLGAEMFEEMFRVAEARGLYDFYYVVRDHGSVRKELTEGKSEQIPRYDICDVEVLPPFTRSRFSTVNLMLGRLATTHARTIVVRGGHLRKEFRK
jgi:hypothetical protein